MVQVGYEFVQGQIMAVMDIIMVLVSREDDRRRMEQVLRRRYRNVLAHSRFDALPVKMKEGHDDVYKHLIAALTSTPEKEMSSDRVD